MGEPHVGGCRVKCPIIHPQMPTGVIERALPGPGGLRLVGPDAGAVNAGRRTPEDYLLGLLCGIPLLLAGVAGGLVALLDPPSDLVAHLMAGGVGLMGTVFGVGFPPHILPAWSFLLRHRSWLPGAALLPAAAGFIPFAADANQNSTRISSPRGSAIYEVGMLVLARILL